MQLFGWSQNDRMNVKTDNMSNKKKQKEKRKKEWKPESQQQHAASKIIFRF